MIQLLVWLLVDNLRYNVEYNDDNDNFDAAKMMVATKTVIYDNDDDGGGGGGGGGSGDGDNDDDADSKISGKY